MSSAGPDANRPRARPATGLGTTVWPFEREPDDPVIARAVADLCIFRFCDLRACTLSCNGGEELIAAFEVYDLEALLRMLPERPEVDVTPRLQGELSIDGVPVRVYAVPGRVQLSISGASGDLWKVDDDDIERAAALETLLAPVAGLATDPPRSDGSCLSPASHAELFAPD